MGFSKKFYDMRISNSFTKNGILDQVSHLRYLKLTTDRDIKLTEFISNFEKALEESNSLKVKVNCKELFDIYKNMFELIGNKKESINSIKCEFKNDINTPLNILFSNSNYSISWNFNKDFSEVIFNIRIESIYI